MGGGSRESLEFLANETLRQWLNRLRQFTIVHGNYDMKILGSIFNEFDFDLECFPLVVN